MCLVFKRILVPFLVVLLLTSCSTMYQPNSLNIPILEKMGEGSLLVTTGTNVFEVQSAYAISDNYAIMFNYSKAKNSDNENFKQDFGEFAVGYFTLLSNINVGEFYIGGGYGESSSFGNLFFNKIVDTTFQTRSAFYRLFIQTNFGIKGDFAEVGFAMRASLVHFTKIKIDSNVENISINSPFITPALFLRLGGPFFKFNAQIGYSALLSNSNFFLYEPVVMSLGIAMRIGQ